MAKARGSKKPAEIAVIGDVDDWEADVVKELLGVPPGGECVFYIDSAGGSVYGALAVLTLLRQRKISATAYVLGECSSATVLLFAGCRRRFVTPFSTLFFHRMRWQSEKRVSAEEAHLWARHFDDLERELDQLQARLFGAGEDQLRQWINGSQYVTGAQMAAAGLAELIAI
jgi:ATP-dependent Clp protease, protease subunit